MVASRSSLFVAAACWLLSSVAALDIKVSSSGGNATSGHQYGYLHEDINNSGDGGIYAELIRNRAFQGSPLYPVSLTAWHPFGGAVLSLKNLSSPLSSALPTSMNVAPGSTSSSGQIGFYNDGYWGMDVRRQQYTGSFWVRGAYDGVFTAWFLSNLTSDVWGSVQIQSKAKADEWVEHEIVLVPTKDAPNSNNTFAITFDPKGVSGGSLDFNLISVFPPTFKGRANGLRVDLAEALYEMHPTFFRFPGGNMLEGNNNKSRWDWKNSIGPLKDRPGFEGVWGYQQTNGLGLMEYLYWAEDMGMKRVLAVWDGLSLNGDITPQDQLDPFIQDALDEIEFIRGPATSKWGAVRASLGHPDPFELEYVEVGNEDWLAGGAAGLATYNQYRLPMFLKAINAAYPDIQVIASGASTDNTTLPANVYGDYHPYRTPDSFVKEFNRFDHDVTHIAGEVAAVHVNGGIEWSGNLYPYPWWIGSVSEAVSLIGYERNADRLKGAMYAPVMRNMNRWQWSVTMLQFAADPKLTTRSTSWHVWQLLAAHPMSHTLPETENFGPVYYVSGFNDTTGGHIWKGAVYNTTGGADVPVRVTFEGVAAGTRAALTVLTGNGDPYAYNDPFTGVNIVHTQTYFVTSGPDGAFAFSLPQLSVAVLDTNYKSACKSSRKRSLRR